MKRGNFSTKESTNWSISSQVIASGDFLNIFSRSFCLPSSYWASTSLKILQSVFSSESRGSLILFLISFSFLKNHYSKNLILSSYLLLSSMNSFIERRSSSIHLLSNKVYHFPTANIFYIPMISSSANQEPYQKASSSTCPIITSASLFLTQSTTKFSEIFHSFLMLLT